MTTVEHIFKKGVVIGYVCQDEHARWWFGMGDPEAKSFIRFLCKSREHGIACIKNPALYTTTFPRNT